MKRDLLVHSHQSSASPRDSYANYKFNRLLRHYLDLQKENVRKKSKIRSAKQNIETLVREVRFLRQRYEYLINSQFYPVREEMVVNEGDAGQGRGKEDQGWEMPTIQNNRPTNCIIDENKDRE